MTSLKDKIQNALDENRMLVLGAEVLVGFELLRFFRMVSRVCRSDPKC